MAKLSSICVTVLILAVSVCIYGSRSRKLLASGDVLVTAASSHYQVIDLGTLPADNWTEANGINDKGQVLCTAGIRKDYDPHIGNSRAFLWEKGRQQDIGRLAHYPNSQGIAINNRGQILGKALLSASFFSPFRVFLWQQGTICDLKTLSLPGADPSALSDQGDIVGSETLDVKGSQYKAFLWKNEKAQNLRLPLGSVANDVNHCGATQPLLIIGELRGTGFLWRNGKLTKLRLAGTWGTQLRAVNASGQSVGCVSLATGHSHALLWHNGRTTDLGTFAPKQDSIATAINNKGMIVGWATTAPNNAMHAVLWNGKSIKDLNEEITTSPGIILSSAKGINNHDQIICDGYPADASNTNQQHAYLLVPH